MGHLTVDMSDQMDSREWNVTVLVDDEIHSNVTVVDKPTKFQALQAAWIHVKKNQEKYGIDEWKQGRLAIEVSRSS